jgi:transcriptional regulator GlxA family with amidase domain
MRRRQLLAGAAAAGAWARLGMAETTAGAGRLSPPAKGKIPVAFVMGPGATMIDFAGPWEVFQDVMLPQRGESHDDDQMPFQLFTVAEKPATLRTSGGMQVLPDHTVSDAPQPRVIVIPAHQGSEKLVEWIGKASAAADITMSVCAGAFALARTGLLKGKTATTHHDFLDDFAKRFPDVQVRRGVRFVEHERVATAAGLSAGIDLALRVVERYFGRDAAQRTATYMEYESRGWIV